MIWIVSVLVLVAALLVRSVRNAERERNAAQSALFIAKKDLDRANDRIRTLTLKTEKMRLELESDTAYAVRARADFERKVAADLNRLEKLAAIIRSALEWIPPETQHDNAIKKSAR